MIELAIRALLTSAVIVCVWHSPLFLKITVIAIVIRLEFAEIQKFVQERTRR